MSNFNFNGMVNINGKSYSGNNISIINNKVFIDGKDVTPDSKEINIVVTGNIQSLTCDHANKVEVNGDVEYVKTMSANVECRGVIKGDVKTMSGNVDAMTIGGSVKTMSGNIRGAK